jgi:hypothetical protein
VSLLVVRGQQVHLVLVLAVLVVLLLLPLGRRQLQRLVAPEAAGAPGALVVRRKGMAVLVAGLRAAPFLLLGKVEEAVCLCKMQEAPRVVTRFLALGGNKQQRVALCRLLELVMVLAVLVQVLVINRITLARRALRALLFLNGDQHEQKLLHG